MRNQKVTKEAASNYLQKRFEHFHLATQRQIIATDERRVFVHAIDLTQIGVKRHLSDALVSDLLQRLVVCVHFQQL